jgi:hypothetical protein
MAVSATPARTKAIPVTAVVVTYSLRTKPAEHAGDDGSRSVTVDAMVALARQGELLLPVLPDRRESLVSGSRVHARRSRPRSGAVRRH